MIIGQHPVLVSANPVPSEKVKSQINCYHQKMIFTAGMGFFTDAYDLFIIGVVTSLLIPIWHLTIFQLAILNGASLASAAIGAVTFGYLADKFGRSKMYGFEILILVIGSILSAVAMNFMWLICARVIVGLGIGGDYPSSAVVVGEHANHQRRGFLMLLVFAMQAVGLIVGPLIATLFLSLNIDPHLVWRILLGFGAIPAASVFYLRRSITETPHFIMNKNAPVEVSSVIDDMTRNYPGQAKATLPKKQNHQLWSLPWLRYLVGTAGAWFLLDVAFYGNGISSTLILNTLKPHASIIHHILITSGMFFLFAVPGYFFAARYVDKIGRKPIQILGFIVMAICYGVIGLVPEITTHLPLFILLFGLSFFFINFGPNTTTFLIPSEIFPTSIRATAHGLSAAIGKVGAFMGAFLLPLILQHFGLSITMQWVSLISLVGVFLTLLVPEMKNRELMV